MNILWESGHSKRIADGIGATVESLIHYPKRENPDTFMYTVEELLYTGFNKSSLLLIVGDLSDSKHHYTSLLSTVVIFGTQVHQTK